MNRKQELCTTMLKPEILKLVLHKLVVFKTSY